MTAADSEYCSLHSKDTTHLSKSSSQYVGPLPSRRSPSPPPPPKKLLNVTITILSITGVQVKESTKKKKLTSKLLSRGSGKNNNKNEDEISGVSTTAADQSAVAQQQQPTTTVVTSFQRTEKQATDGRNNNASKTIMTHVPSLPLLLPTTNKNNNNNINNKNGGGGTTFNEVIHWPTQDSSAHSKLSSYTFSRYFTHENDNTFPPAGMSSSSSDDGDNHGRDGESTSTVRYVPQLCPIQVSISRNGKMHKLGSAHLFISGNENGSQSGSTMLRDVPVVNFDTAFKSAEVAHNRKIYGNGGTAAISGSGVHMLRLKDDTLKCGLAERATLRVLVRVSEPPSLTERIHVIYGVAEQKQKGPVLEDEKEEESVVVAKKKKSLDGYLEKSEKKKMDRHHDNIFPPSSMKGRELNRQSRSITTSKKKKKQLSSSHHSKTVDDTQSFGFQSHAKSTVPVDDHTVSITHSNSTSSASEQIIKMISDNISHNKKCISSSYNTPCHHPQPYTYKSRGGVSTNSSKNQNALHQRIYSTTSSMATDSTTSTGNSSYDDSLLPHRQHQQQQQQQHKERSSSSRMMSSCNHWSRRLMCCVGSGSTSGFGDVVPKRRNRNDNDELVDDYSLSVWGDNSLEEDYTIGTEYTY